MTKRLERQFEHGIHVAEYLDEVAPLGEDRKTIFLPEMDVFAMAEMGGRTLGMFLSELLAPLAEKFGDEVWETGRSAMYEVGRKRAAGMARRMKVEDINDARNLGRIIDLEASLTGVRGEWVEWGRKRAVKHEYECPQAKPCQKCPRVCTTLLEAMEEGTFDALGVNVKKPIVTQVMPEGAPYCEVVIELLDQA